MLSAGVDVGAETTKAVVIDDKQVLGASVVPSGWDTQSSVRSALSQAIRDAGVDEKSITHIGTTGMGGKNTGLEAPFFAYSTCSALGASWLFPLVRTVIDIGAEQSQAMVLSSEGGIVQYTRNDQCAAGAGAFITEMSLILELNIGDIGRVSLLSRNKVTLNSTCTIFAESEVISLINEGHDKNDVARAVCDAVALKAACLLQELKIEKEIVFIGGVARNAVIADYLKSKIGQDIVVPQEPRIITAVGAARADSYKMKFGS